MHVSSRGWASKWPGVDRDLSRFATDLRKSSCWRLISRGAPWPFVGRRFDGIVVTNYLHRPLLPILVDSLEPGGVFVYETFAQGNERFGKPSNPAFLLAPANCSKPSGEGSGWSPTKTGSWTSPVPRLSSAFAGYG
jgi:hypothetical protein